MIYEFECSNCKKVIETDEFSMSNCPKTIKCECGSDARKIISIPSKPKPIFYNVPDIPKDSESTNEE